MTQIALTSPTSLTIQLDRGRVFSVTPGASSSMTIAIPRESVAQSVLSASTFGPYASDLEVTLNLSLGTALYEVLDSAAGSVDAASIYSALDAATTEELALIQDSVAKEIVLVGSGYDPVTNTGVDMTAQLQAALNAAAGVCRLRLVGDFMITNEISVPSNSFVDGMGGAGKIHLKKNSVVADIHGTAVVRIGTRTQVSSNVTIRGLCVYVYQSVSGDLDHSFYGIAGKCEQGVLNSASNITVEYCRVYDSSEGIAIAKDGVAYLSTAPERLAARFKNVSFCNNYVEQTDNKALEIQETVGARMDGNICINVAMGPQYISSNEMATMNSNVVQATQHGLSVTHGAKNIIVSGNTVTVTGAGAIGFFIRVENYAATSTIDGLTITGNHIRHEGGSGFILKFHSEALTTGWALADVEIVGNVLMGNGTTAVICSDGGYHPELTDFTRVSFRSNKISTLITYNLGHLKSTTDCVISDNDIYNVGTIVAKNLRFIGNRFATSVSIGNTSSAVRVHFNYIGGPSAQLAVLGGAVQTVIKGNVCAAYADYGTGTLTSWLLQ